MLKKICSCLLLLLFCLSSCKAWYGLQKGFRLGKVTDSYNLFSTWKKEELFYGKEKKKGIFYRAPELSPSFLKTLFSQPFYFLGKGQQCFAFVSQDQKYVLKLIRKDKFYLKPWWHISLFSSWKKRLKKSQDRNFARIEESLQIVQEKLAPENQVLGIHFGLSKDLGLAVDLIDSIGRKKTLDLDHSYFVLQKKVVPLEEVVKKASFSEIQKISEKILQAAYARAKKGVRNKNRHCLVNMGLFEGKVMEIDLAEFRNKSMDREKVLEEVQKSTAEYVQFLEKTDPYLREDFGKKWQRLKEQHEETW